MKTKLLNASSIIGMLIVLFTSAVWANEGIFSAKPNPVLPTGEAITVDEKDIIFYQITLAELKQKDGVGFIRSIPPSSPLDIKLIAPTDIVSALVDVLTKKEVLTILTRPSIATLVDQRALIVSSNREGTLVYEIELLPQNRGDDIRTTITLTRKEIRDGKVHRIHTVTTFHIQQAGTTMLLCGKFDDENILFAIEMQQRNENE